MLFVTAESSTRPGWQFRELYNDLSVHSFLLIENFWFLFNVTKDSDSYNDFGKIYSVSSTYFLMCKVGSSTYLLGLVGDLDMLINAALSMVLTYSNGP